MRFVFGLMPASHHMVWLKALRDLHPGDRLLIVAPPDHAKSTVIGLVWSSWLLGQDPDHVHIGYVSNTARQANRESVAVRDLVAYSKRFNLLFPKTRLDQNKGTSENEWFVQRTDPFDKDASFQCSGIGGPLVGARLTHLIIDDPADPENMGTPYQRQKCIDWLKQVALTRLVEGGYAVCIMTRWHEEDPAGIFKKEGWKVVTMPAIQEDGSALWPARWSLESLLKIRDDPTDPLFLGARVFAMMYQGEVTAEGGNVFKSQWFKYWNAVEGYGLPLRIVQSYDTAFSEKRTADFSVCTTWALTVNGHYLLDLYQKQVEFPQLKRDAVALWQKWNAEYVLVEGAASGKSLIQELRQGTLLPLVEVQPVGDKMARAQAVTPEFETGRVFFPRDAMWLSRYEHELEIFPAGQHDDMVDSTTQYLNWVRGRSGRPRRTDLEQRKESLWRERGESR